MTLAASHPEDWPGLPLDAWGDTYATLHMWLQIVGEIRLRYSPPTNHSWHTTLYVTARGLTTSPMPYGGHAFDSADLREFILPYDVVRESASPDDTLLAFFQTTYDAAADLGRWDRHALERRDAGRSNV